MVGRRSTAAALPDAVLVKVVVHPLHEAEQVSPAVVLHGQIEVGAVLEGVVQLGQPRRGVSERNVVL